MKLIDILPIAFSTLLFVIAIARVIKNRDQVRTMPIRQFVLALGIAILILIAVIVITKQSNVDIINDLTSKSH